MRHLNYNHLQYFWVVAREGSIAKAADALSLTPQTISGQLKLLEEDVGTRLFNRVGRRLVLADAGKKVFQYADEIFAIGAELATAVRSQQSHFPEAFAVGIVNSIPKLIAQRTLAPAFALDTPVKVVCHEGSLKQLLARLAIHEIDLVLSDQPMPRGLSVKAYAHLLGTSGVSFFVRRSDARQYNKKFPNSLNNAPLLSPADGTELRRQLDDWFDKNAIVPNIVAEFDDSALLKALGEAGVGVFPAPSAIESEICRMYGAAVIGRVPEMSENFYAISPERQLKHPAVVAITDAARVELFPERI
ncbi:MAG: transcriptional activator NhaR [Gammaproteobacteria bacterium]